MDRIEELRKRMIEAAKRGVKEKFGDADVHIIKSVSILEDIDPISNLLTEQLREWHSVHFPELNDIVKDNDVYLKLVSQVGKREDFSGKEAIEKIGDEELAAKISEAARNSIGSDVSERDLGEMKALALNCINLRQQREYLAGYLEETMKREMPNFTELAGAIIGAKILAKAGGKKKLAFLPASAIQMIGAEKALFLHFKTGASSPKYGYLFQHPMVKAVQDRHRGKIARSLAAKLAIACRKDYFGNHTGAGELTRKLEERIAAIGKIVKEKPKRPQAGKNTSAAEIKPQGNMRPAGADAEKGAGSESQEQKRPGFTIEGRGPRPQGRREWLGANRRREGNYGNRGSRDFRKRNFTSVGDSERRPFDAGRAGEIRGIGTSGRRAFNRDGFGREAGRGGSGGFRQEGSRSGFGNGSVRRKFGPERDMGREAGFRSGHGRAGVFGSAGGIGFGHRGYRGDVGRTGFGGREGHGFGGGYRRDGGQSNWEPRHRGSGFRNPNPLSETGRPHRAARGFGRGRSSKPEKSIGGHGRENWKSKAKGRRGVGKAWGSTQRK